LRAQLFETDDEIVGQISPIAPETSSRRSHQVETRGCASIPLITDAKHRPPWNRGW